MVPKLCRTSRENAGCGRSNLNAAGFRLLEVDHAYSRSGGSLVVVVGVELAVWAAMMRAGAPVATARVVTVYSSVVALGAGGQAPFEIAGRRCRP